MSWLLLTFVLPKMKRPLEKMTFRLQLSRISSGSADDLLKDAGTSKENILSATIWLNSMDDFSEMNQTWDEWVPENKAPCRACVESPRLAASHFNVEIGIIAAK